MTTTLDFGTTIVHDLTVLIQHINGGYLGAVGNGLLQHHRVLIRPPHITFMWRIHSFK
jgi:hypothetical protein